MEMIKKCIDTLNSNEITPEEVVLGSFTRIKLKHLKKWDEQKAG